MYGRHHKIRIAYSQEMATAQWEHYAEQLHLPMELYDYAADSYFDAYGNAQKTTYVIPS
ncbi:hypothetical protein KSZ_52290 [Dictyobacter formicarum]|uniref:Uncharacterized protein n=1 Tax=Dictyobacter formicarum TaxID=2778368 RepID=A0ABQ3VN44_9CHLR|nr:hypothetical protein KSZ_52290 [Dictyobacter formicarum]